MDQDAGVPEVRPPTIDDVRRICRALDEAGARYVLIGGFAVILHGGQRTTKDIDSDAADRAWLEALREGGR